jgi:hypothetical protein
LRFWITALKEPNSGPFLPESEMLFFVAAFGSAASAPVLAADAAAVAMNWRRVFINGAISTS